MVTGQSRYRGPLAGTPRGERVEDGDASLLLDPVPPPTDARSQVPELGPGKVMPFENRWRALTMARLRHRYGWTLRQIGEHFGLGEERVRQLVKIGARTLG